MHEPYRKIFTARYATLRYVTLQDDDLGAIKLG